MTIYPTGPDDTLTREELLKIRDRDAKKMRERWAKQKEKADERTDD